jgi:hypothetical protein
MTVREAREILRPPLLFGDPRQVEAAEVMGLFGQAVELTVEDLESKDKAELCEFIEFIQEISWEF